MKILYSAYSCNPNYGSEGGNGWNWSYYNAMEGHDVWCITQTEEKKNIDVKMRELVGINLNFCFVSVPNWVRKLYKYQPGVYFHYLVWQHLAYKAASALHKKVGFDLVHHTTLGSLQLGTELWKLNAPLIFGPVGGGQMAPKAFKSYFYEFWRGEIARSVVSNLLQKFNPNAKGLARNSALILTSNEDTFEMAKKSGARKVKYCSDSGLPDDFFPEEIPERKTKEVLRILWVGRLFARKGLPLVLEALSKVNPNTKFLLTIVGYGLMGKYIPAWIKQFKLEGKVDWKGRIPWEQVKFEYMDHDLFMFCSLRDSTATQLLEAMAYGLPLITLNHHGAKTLVPDNAGIKVDVTSREETVTQLAKAVDKMYNDPGMMREFGRNGFEFAKTLSWTNRIQHIQRFYDDVYFARIGGTSVFPKAIA